MKAFWTYTLARLAVFAVTFGVVRLIASFWLESTTVTNLWVLLIALVVSSVVSIFLLARLRDRLARNIQERATRMTERIEESRRAEDVD
jgi:membrane protein implicated in regulation of membrane protease activity